MIEEILQAEVFDDDFVKFVISDVKKSNPPITYSKLLSIAEEFDNDDQFASQYNNLKSEAKDFSWRKALLNLRENCYKIFQLYNQDKLQLKGSTLDDLIALVQKIQMHELFKHKYIPAPQAAVVEPIKPGR